MRVTASRRGSIVGGLPCGVSTATKAAPWSSSQPSVLGAALLVQPGAVTELDGEAWGAKVARRSSSSSRRLFGGLNDGESCSRKDDSLPASMSGLIGAQIALGELAVERRARVGRGRAGWCDAVAQSLGECRRSALWRESGLVELDVEGEALGCDRGPATDGRGAGSRVGGVDLDRLEALGVVGQLLARRAAGRVPLGDEAGVAQLEVPTTMLPAHTGGATRLGPRRSPRGRRRASAGR